MRTLYLDSYLGPVQDRSVFEASVSPHDYDVVVWEPHHTFRRYEDRANGNLEKGRPALSVDIGGKLRALTNEWRKRFREYMVDGGILVVLLPDDVRLMLERDLERIARNSWSNSNPSKYSALDILTAIPLGVKTSLEGTGRMIEITDPRFSGLAAAWDGHLTYHRSITAPVATLAPGLRIQGTQRVVGGRVKGEERGTVVLLPDVQREDSGINSGSNQASRGSDVLADEFNRWLAETFTEEPNELPDWTKTYQFASELKRDATRQKLEEQRSNASKNLEALASSQMQDDRLKQLIAATGKPLEEVVSEALCFLGFKVEEREGRRADIYATGSSGDRGLVEVKGASKSASERKAAQLEKWVLEAMDADERRKGILIVNGWRDRPLSSRCSPVFPNQMVGFSTARSHCLMTTTQLLGMVIRCGEDKSLLREAEESILSTVGRLEGWDDIGSIFAKVPDDEIRGT